MHAPTHENTTFGNQSISVGVVGCGYWGPNLIRNLSNMPNCTLRAVCDRSIERLNHMTSLYPGVEGTTEFDHMLNGMNIDAVVVATPVKYHYPLAKAALLAGKHVFIEKPMASSVAQCEELIELADEKGLTLMVGHTFLYSEPVRKICEIIESGAIGDIRYINSQRLNLGLFQQDINVAWDLAPHDISIILHLLKDNPDTVNCQGKAHITPGIQDVTNISLDFGGKRFATIQSSWLEPRKVRQMTIVGTKKMIVYNDLEPHDKIRVYDTRVDRDGLEEEVEEHTIDAETKPPHYDTFGEFQYSYHYGGSTVPHIRQSEPLRVEMDHFLECISTGMMPLSSGQQGLEMVRILEATSLSLNAAGSPVRLSEMPQKKNSTENGTKTDARPTNGGEQGGRPTNNGSLLANGVSPTNGSRQNGSSDSPTNGNRPTKVLQNTK